MCHPERALRESKEPGSGVPRLADSLGMTERRRRASRAKSAAEAKRESQTKVAIHEDSSLFVYGSLLDGSFRERLLGRPVRTLPARLPDYERRRGRYLYVVKRVGREVEGLLIFGLDRSDFETLDRHEEVPLLYTRERVEVIAGDGGRLRCWLYVPAPRLLAEGGR